MRNILSVISLLTVFLLSVMPFCIFSLELKGEYNEMGIYKVYNIKNSFTLKCEADEIDVEVVWYKNDEVIADVDELENRYDIDVDKDEEKKTVKSELTIHNSSPHDSGRYSCRILGDNDEDDDDDTVQEFMVVAQIAIKSPSDVVVLEGDTARIHCKVVGYRPIVEWVLPETVNLTKVSYENDTEIEGDQGNILVIEDTVRETDRADYFCEAYSADEFVYETISEGQKLSSKTFLRVKDRNAYLVPVTGLIIVITLFTLIVAVSEYHRKKHQTEDEDETNTFDSPTPQKKPASVRQRKQ